MPTYNRTFQLTLNDIDLIEEALRARGRELCNMRRALSDENPAEMERVRVVEQDQRAGEELLGRLHDQKMFYRPKSGVYVSGSPRYSIGPKAKASIRMRIRSMA